LAEALKLRLDAALVREAARHLHRAWPGFDRERFTTLALAGLDTLELKPRARHIAAALEATLPDDFDALAGTLEASLAPATGDDSLPASGPAGLAGWIVWPLAEVIATRGLAHPERALAALHALTQRWTAEWAIRPFIERHPALVFDTLQRWTTDPSPHVRRLVSEGSRPRLPWGLQLRGLVADPSPTLPLLRALQDDPSAYVRRSVANHLNDIAKDHPGVVADWLARHLPDAPPERVALLRHASRSLVKAGEARVLAAWGIDAPLRGAAALVITPKRIVLGASVTLAVRLRSTARRAQRLVVDYAVHHVKADGRSTAKVFKGWVVELAPGEERRLSRNHAVRPITTRRYHPGRHVVTLQVNGRVEAEAAFDLRVS
jgi:3-methyladenine DNA glycosylase AlkC